MRTCEIDGCHRKHYGLGYCQMHYTRTRSHGDSTTVKPGHRYTDKDAAQRLSARSKPQGDCIVYTFGRPSRSGHRTMGFHGRVVGVHRIAWILAHGELAPGIAVLHRCDVPNCIKVNHLFLGTVADNNADRDRKGRHRPLPGSSNGSARLSEYQIIEIRGLISHGYAQQTVADRYGVSQSTIWGIANRRSWKHVGV